MAYGLSLCPAEASASESACSTIGYCCCFIRALSHADILPKAPVLGRRLCS